MSVRLTVLISGGGSNLRAILDAIAQGRIDGEVCCVIADRDCAGIAHALEYNIAFGRVRRNVSRATFADNLLRLIPRETDIIVLAGFLSILPTEVIAAWPQRIINLHPSLLPAYGGEGMYGLHVHRAVLAAGECRSGCTLHYVDSGIDTGQIIAQAEVPVLPSDTAEVLQKRVQVAEHSLLCETLASLCANFNVSAKKDSV